MIGNILGQNSFWIVNKAISKEVGLEASILLSDLITKQSLFDSDWFFNTVENIEEDTTLSYYKQKSAINILKEKGLIDTKVIGVPAKLHFKINEKAIIEILEKKPILSNTSSRETRILEVEKVKDLKSKNSNTLNNNKINNNKINNNKINNIKKDLPTKKNRDIPLSEVNESNSKFTKIQIELANKLFFTIRNNMINLDMPIEKLKGTAEWANQIKLAMVEGFTEDKIESAINYLGSTKFWWPNILSVSKFRDKLPTLYAQYSNNNNSKIHTIAISSKAGKNEAYKPDKIKERFQAIAFAVKEGMGEEDINNLLKSGGFESLNQSEILLYLT